MAVPRRLSRLALLLPLALAATVAHAETQARLAHCGEDTCLRISGQRPGAGVSVHAGGNPLPVEGERSWSAMLPIETARAIADPGGARMHILFVDSATGAQSSESVAMPPGALGKRVELSTLMISAH